MSRLPRILLAFLLPSAFILHPSAVAAELPPSLDGAIDRGLLFLQKQQKEDGSFDAQGPPHAIAGLALLAFLAAGHTPDVGKYGPVVRAALDHLLAASPEGGYYGRDGSRLYGHCIVTIALAEVHGTETDDATRRKVRAALERCLKVLYAAQDARKEDSARGGWRYELNSSDSDLSVTAWAILAYRACQDAGVVVPRERVERALAYLLRCQQQRDARAFAYQPGGDPSPPMTGAALQALFLLDASERIDLRPLERYLVQRPVRDGDRYFYYGHYAVAQGAFQAGGATWDAVWKNASSQLLAMQRKDDGSWPRREDPGGDGRRGRVYSTTMAVLTLSVPLRLLPMYQR